MQKRRNDVKARTTLLLALPNEHQLRFSKYKTAQELWAAILKTFGGNGATKKTKKNLLKKQYGNFKAEGKEMLEQTFNRLQAIILEEDWEKDFHSRECRAPKSQDRGRRENFKHEENHALVADKETPTELALMAKSSSDNEVFGSSLYSKACKKNTDNLNSKITNLSEKLSDSKTMLYHYKLGLSHVEARLVEFKNQEINFCEKIRGLEFKVESKTNRIENLTNELEMLKKEKERLDRKLTCFQSASKDLDNLIGRLPKFADDTITDYTRPSASIESNPNDLQNNSSFVSEIGESTSSILSKPEIKFVKASYSPTVIKINKDETVRKPSVKYAKIYRKPLKSSNVRVRTQVRVPRVPTVNRKFPTVNRKFPTGNSKVSTADLRNKGKAIKASACWIWKHRQNSTDKGNSQNNIDDKGYWDSGCSRHMTGKISYLFDYEPYDGGP
nr:ribonuclease H-like domain-containing protein [Tanacetum cinerariifolium]